MDIFDIIFTRRSIRRYSEKTIPDEMVNKILKAGMYAPSAVNKQPWHFIVFKDKAIQEAILEVHKNASMLREANLGIVVCYDENLQHDEGYGIIDCSAATQNMLLAAHQLGLGACWVGICPRENRIKALKLIFKLPDHIIPFSVISLGFPAETKKTPDRFKKDRIHFDTW